MFNVYMECGAYYAEIWVLFCKKEVAVDMPAAIEDDNFLMGTKDTGITHVEVQRTS